MHSQCRTLATSVIGKQMGVLVACWLKCWPAIERLQVQAPLGSGFFSPMGVLSSTLQNEEVFITASFGGDVKP